MTGEHSSGLDRVWVELDTELAAGLDALGLALADTQRFDLLRYLALLKRWNKAYNLTSIDEPGEMVARHLLDSLSIQPFLQGTRIMDSGTGAGLPGVPLAIAAPERSFRLVDGNGKKIRFLRQVRRELSLSHVLPIHSRLEDLPLKPQPDTITARALAPLARLVDWHERWLAAGACLLAMKGRIDEKEISAVPAAYNVELVDLEVPGLGARRSLAIITRP